MTGEFERLDLRMVLLAAVVSGGMALLTALGVGIAALFSDMPWVVVVLLAVLLPVGLIVVVTGVEYIRWRATRFRVTEERLELDFQFVMTKRRALSRDRIRSVDVTANILYRVFGLAKVVVGTGQQGSAGTSKITLDPLPADRAHRLRVELLDRGVVSEETDERHGAIATLNWAWAKYAPLSFLTPLFAAAVIGAGANVGGWFAGENPGFVFDTVGDFIRAAALIAYVTIVGTALLVGAVGALLLFVEMWWDYRLDRERNGTLHVRRGLLTSRSISLEERRLRGVEVVEPLGVRVLGAARVDAVATGMNTSASDSSADHKTLLPAAPKDVADGVAAAVLREDVTPTSAARLRPHPRAALSRRLRWSIAPVALAAILLAVAELLAGQDPSWLVADLLLAGWILVVVAVPIALVIGFDAYRNLGHAISGGYLVVRSGAMRRRTVALQRSGVIGWTVRQSIFQRRASVITLVATTAAGNGAYPVPDVDAVDGVAFADTAVEGLLTPFVQLPYDGHDQRQRPIAQ